VHSESLVEEPYVWEIRLSGSVEGLENNRGTTEEGPSLLDQNKNIQGFEKLWIPLIFNTCYGPLTQERLGKNL
jgi:hypothetical protein